MPRETVQRFHADRRHWLRAHKINPDLDDWRERLAKLRPEQRSEFYRVFSGRWHRELDQCQGECVLKNHELARIVYDSLLHFDGDRYEMWDFVIMPNHVHLLVAFRSDDSMVAQCESWKRYTARAIHQESDQSGRFWQQDVFDHLVRSAEQFQHFRNYIADNPIKAGLRPHQSMRYTRGVTE